MRRAAVITVTGLIAALVLSPTSAVADLGTFPDAPDDVSAVPYVDFSSMDVSNTRQRVRVKYRSRSADNQSATEILWLDASGPRLQLGGDAATRQCESSPTTSVVSRPSASR